jgi:hypothetical protein
VDDLAQQAIGVLHGNDRGAWTRPSPRLYPHQWSWDAAFVAMGWAQLDVSRAISELSSLFRAQWSTGMVPQIVFDLNVARGAYEPGPNAWATVGHAPLGTASSAICQPPVHAIALARIREVAAERGRRELHEVDAAIVDLHPRLARWHAWLRSARDPDGTGLVTIFHPWESGLDNSPRWDGPLAGIELPGVDDQDQDHDHDPEAGLLPPRPDLTYVADPAERPTEGEYRRYRYLVDRLIAVDHDQAAAMATHPFRVADVWFSAILAAADDCLAGLAEIAGHSEAADRHRADADRTRTALDACWDPELRRCLDIDRTTGNPIISDTIAGFAPLLAGCEVDRAGIIVERLFGPSFAGAPGLAWAVPPSTAVDDPAFDPKGYWRGPHWPPMTWLLCWAMRRAGHHRAATRLRQIAVQQLRTTGCCEYVQPCTGAPLGSDAQSWTAAVALDWLAEV